MAMGVGVGGVLGARLSHLLVEPDRLVAATAGLACFGLAAELAAAGAEGPGSFKRLLFDALFNLTPERLKEGMRVVDLGTEG